MAERDEKELVLGNKQLISLFFLAVALCGVFFALGYMIGHNASKGSIANLDGTTGGTPDAARPSAAAPVTDNAAPVATTTDPAGQAPETYTQPAREAQTAQPAVAAVPAPVNTAPPVARKAAEAVAAAPAAAAIAQPETGATYVQVTALRRADAQNLVRTLREQSLPAILADSSKPELFRVLVGPYHQTTDVADAKARLKGLGFANAFVQKQ